MNVDVVIPVFGHAHLVTQALRSLGQQGVSVRVVVVDDGNPTPLVLPTQDLEGNPVDVSVIRCSQRGGIARARNVGLNHCTADAVLFLDADDELQPGALRVLVERLHAGGSDAVFGFVEEFGIEVSGERSARASRQPAALAGSTLLRRQSVSEIGGFDESLGVGEFIDVMARGQRRGWKVESLDIPVLRRRIHDRNTSWRGDAGDFLRVIRRHLDGESSTFTP